MRSSRNQVMARRIRSRKSARWRIGVLTGVAAVVFGAAWTVFGAPLAHSTVPSVVKTKQPKLISKKTKLRLPTMSEALQKLYAEPLPSSALLNVPAISQLPQLPDGCEMTSLSMLLSAAGHPTSKMWLAAHMPVDPTPLRTNAEGQPVYWGNPNVGFVGDVYTDTDGYGIYNGPVTKFLNQILPGRALNLTGKPFRDDLATVASGRPVVLWTTATFQPTDDWVTWQSPEGPVHATFEEHAVLLVGYKGDTLYINNPLNGEKDQAVNKEAFLEAWDQLGHQAVTYTPQSVKSLLSRDGV